MVPSGLPTGTVSSGRDGPESSRDYGDAVPDARARIAELERENEALRAAVEKQRRENERIVERCERLLDQPRASSRSDAPESVPTPGLDSDSDWDSDSDSADTDTDTDTSTIERLTDLLGR
jgi:hypothetical protein